MYCSHCGKEVENGALTCPQCGFLIKKEEIKPVKSFGAIKVFMILGCILNAFLYLIPLCWCIPMTISLNKKIENGEKCSTSFKVCTLLFVSMISGILLLCDNDI